MRDDWIIVSLYSLIQFAEIFVGADYVGHVSIIISFPWHIAKRIWFNSFSLFLIGRNKVIWSCWFVSGLFTGTFLHQLIEWKITWKIAWNIFDGFIGHFDRMAFSSDEFPLGAGESWRYFTEFFSLFVKTILIIFIKPLDIILYHCFLSCIQVSGM